MQTKGNIERIKNGLESCKIGSKILLTILKKEIDSSDYKIKLAVETYRQTAQDYFYLLGIIKKQTDYLIVIDEKESLFVEGFHDYLEGAYKDGINAINDSLDHLLMAIEKGYKDTLSTDKLKQISASKKVATEDYFYLLGFVTGKEKEMSKIRIVETPEEEKEEVVSERMGGYAERYAT